ncbi:hypothetical protein, partial [Arthrobacter sp. PsM3]|uniref:hypothetical protein n=1 Tax=Arthrobacter sp. PsM3 TaxID=3030531 RepID=UPI00263ACA18
MVKPPVIRNSWNRADADGTEQVQESEKPPVRNKEANPADGRRRLRGRVHLGSHPDGRTAPGIQRYGGRPETFCHGDGDRDGNLLGFRTGACPGFRTGACPGFRTGACPGF